MVPNRGIEIALKPTVGGANRILPSGFVVLVVTKVFISLTLFFDALTHADSIKFYNMNTPPSIWKILEPIQPKIMWSSY
jgi:hypothetical protein